MSGRTCESLITQRRKLSVAIYRTLYGSTFHTIGRNINSNLISRSSFIGTKKPPRMYHSTFYPDFRFGMRRETLLSRCDFIAISLQLRINVFFPRPWWVNDWNYKTWHFPRLNFGFENVVSALRWNLRFHVQINSWILMCTVFVMNCERLFDEIVKLNWVEL